MQKEELMLQKRLIELSRTADRRGIVSFSDFLNLNELHILHTIPKEELYTQYCTFGGYDYAERQMVAFLSDALCYQYEYPISVLKIRPLQKKFAEELTHRDYLGAILNLGIERCKIGDILVLEQEALVFVHSSLESFLQDELVRVRHTSVQVEGIAVNELSYSPKTETIKGTVASLRLDSLLALAFSPSRSKMVPYIEGGKVFVNGKMISSNGYQIKEADIISVRGLGRFRYVGLLSETKKGRYFVTIEKYI